MAAPAPSPSRLLALPKELRLIVYDMLFQPLTVRPDNFDVYVLYTEWPKRETGIISTLAKTCKTLSTETEDHFESQYLSSMILFFDNVPQLYDFSCAVKELPAPYQEITICIYTSGMKWLYCPSPMRKPANELSISGSLQESRRCETLSSELALGTRC